MSLPSAATSLNVQPVPLSVPKLVWSGSIAIAPQATAYTAVPIPASVLDASSASGGVTSVVNYKKLSGAAILSLVTGALDYKVQVIMNPCSTSSSFNTTQFTLLKAAGSLSLVNTAVTTIPAIFEVSIYSCQ